MSYARAIRLPINFAYHLPPRDGLMPRASAARNVCVRRVRPLTAELWDGPASAAVDAFEFAKARITGVKPNLGENRKVTVKM